MQPAPDPEPEWLFPAEAIYAASYLFYGRAPPPGVVGGGEAVEWGRGRRPEDDEAATRGVWGYAIIILSVVSVVHIYRLSLSDSVAVTTERAAAVALLPTCRPLAHGPPMCYDWERPAMAPPPPDSGSGDAGDGRSYNDEEKTSMECFTEWERPDMAPPGSDSAGDSDWSNDVDDEKAAMECFYDLVRDATRTCGYEENVMFCSAVRFTYASDQATCSSHKIPEWQTPAAMVPPGNGSSGDSNWTGNYDKAIMGCFYSLVRDAAKACFGCSYENVRPDESSR